ncbi:MAG TPA: hypothetical protein VGK48_05865 [Terriglobia bacterium]|jgi:alcohol dehydrogenase class IV
MRTHDTRKNATLKPDVLALLAEQAQAENKTVDDLLDEAARRSLETKRTIAEMDSFIARNRADARAKGIKKSDVVRLVKESRKENRTR